MRTIRFIYLILTAITFPTLVRSQNTLKDTCNISSKSNAIAFAKRQFELTYGQPIYEKLNAKLLNDSTWLVSSNPTLIESKKKNRTIHFGGVSLKFDKATCRVLEIHRWK